MADSEINDLLAFLKNEKGQSYTKLNEVKGVESSIRKGFENAMRGGYGIFGRELAQQSNIPMRQLAHGEANDIGKQFTPILQNIFKEFDEVGRSTKKMRQVLESLGDVMDNVRKKHELVLQQKENMGTALGGSNDIGKGIVGMATSAAGGNIGGMLGAGSLLINGAKALLGAAGTAMAPVAAGGLGGGLVAGGGVVLGGLALATVVAEVAALGIGANKIRQNWPEAATNARAASRARMTMGLGVGGEDILSPFSKTAGNFAVMPENIANLVTGFAGAGGTGLPGGKSEAGMIKLTGVMERMSLRFGVSADEIGKTMGEMNRWALQTPDSLTKSIDKGILIAQKTGQTEMVPEMLRAVATTVGFVSPRTFGTMGGAMQTDKITNVLGDLARYGYRGSAGSQVYGQIAGAVGGMMFDPIKAAFGYGMLGLNMSQMVNPNAPGTVEQVMKGVQGSTFKNAFPGIYGQAALRMMFPDMSAYALDRMSKGQTVKWEKATPEDLGKMASGMLSEPFFHAEQELTRTRIMEITNSLSTNGVAIIESLNEANRWLIMMTAGQLADKGNIWDKVGKFLGEIGLGSTDAQRFQEKMQNAQLKGMLGEGDAPPLNVTLVSNSFVDGNKLFGSSNAYNVMPAQFGGSGRYGVNSMSLRGSSNKPNVKNTSGASTLGAGRLMGASAFGGLIGDPRRAD